MANFERSNRGIDLVQRDGFEYCKNNIINGKCYMKCVKWDAVIRCPARAKMVVDDINTLVVSICFLPSVNAFLVCSFVLGLMCL